MKISQIFDHWLIYILYGDGKIHNKWRIIVLMTCNGFIKPYQLQIENGQAKSVYMHVPRNVPYVTLVIVHMSLTSGNPSIYPLSSFIRN